MAEEALLHVIKIRDQQGVFRIYAAKFIRRTDQAVHFDFRGTELIVPNKDLIEMISLEMQPEEHIH